MINNAQNSIYNKIKPHSAYYVMTYVLRPKVTISISFTLAYFFSLFRFYDNPGKVRFQLYRISSPHLQLSTDWIIFLLLRFQLNHSTTLLQMERRRKQVAIINTNTHWLWLALRWKHAVTRHIKPTKFSSSWRKGSKTSIHEVLWYVFFVLLCTSWKVSSDHAESQNGVLSNSHKISWCSQSKLRWLSSNPTFAQLLLVFNIQAKTDQIKEAFLKNHRIMLLARKDGKESVTYLASSSRM